MNKKTKIALLIGAIAAVVSAVVVVIVFWDKLVAKFPCFCRCEDDFCDETLEDEDALTEEELADYADVDAE